MTREEFQERVGITVTGYEYERIERGYMASTLDKDKWCRWWKREELDNVMAERLWQNKKLSERIDEISEENNRLYTEINRLRQILYDANKRLDEIKKVVAA
jgi:predicted nuclease with TOPRIM domain